VQADDLATYQLKHMRSPKETITLRTFSYLKIGDKFTTSKPNLALRKAAQIQSQIPFLQKKFNWSQRTFDDIDWEVHSAALRTFKCQDRHKIIKFIHHWLPTGKRLHRESKGMYPQSCFLCGAQIETNMHLFQCKHNDQVLISTHLALDILSLREKMKSDRHLQNLLHVGIFEGAYDKKYRPKFSHEHPSVHNIIDRQNAIGWDHVIQGRITKLMVHHQAQYYCSKGIYDGKVYTGK